MKKLDKAEKIARKKAIKVEVRQGVDPLVTPKVAYAQPLKVDIAHAIAYENRAKTAHSLPIDDLNRAINAVKPSNSIDSRNLRNAAIELSRLRAELSSKHNFGIRAAERCAPHLKSEALTIAKRVSHERNVASLRKFRIKWAVLFAKYGI